MRWWMARSSTAPRRRRGCSDAPRPSPRPLLVVRGALEGDLRLRARFVGDHPRRGSRRPRGPHRRRSRPAGAAMSATHAFVAVGCMIVASVVAVVVVIRDAVAKIEAVGGGIAVSARAPCDMLAIVATAE